MKNPLNISFTCLKNKPILKPFGQNFQNFLTVEGVEEEDSSASMLPASAILENFCFSAVSGIHFSSGKSLDWIVCGIEPNIYCLEKIARNTEGRPEKARNIHLEISSKFFKFRNVLLNISETSQYHKNYPDICRKVYVILRLVVILICFAAWIFFSICNYRKD